MPDQFDPDAMVARFRARAEAVRSRGLPPVEGPDRERFKKQAQADFMDFAMPRNRVVCSQQTSVFDAQCACQYRFV
jgi:hypothetical protein